MTSLFNHYSRKLLLAAVFVFGLFTIGNAQVTVSFSSLSSSGDEDAGANLPVLFIDGNVSVPTTVAVANNVSGTAILGTDFDLIDADTIIDIPAGIYDGTNDTAIDLVSITSDPIVEADETIILTLSAPTGDASLGATTTHTYTITNDDTAVVTIADVSGAENGGPITVTVLLDNAVDGGFDVGVSTADGTATIGDNDYVAVTNQTLSFAGAASETETFTITLGGDDKVEIDETIAVSLSNLVPATVASGNINVSDGAEITISNDDSATVTIADASGNEDDGVIELTVTLDKEVDGGLTVDISTVDGTATIGDNDYTAVSNQTLTFSGTVGETETFNVSPTADSVIEPNENLSISMSNAIATTVDVA
ncbi:MAG: hypothetical protein OIF50_07405, partial [Flavobacteriaceae bacterium]|nr:hypothetical protein [Flavobacteriaceae bacterium]